MVPNVKADPHPTSRLTHYRACCWTGRVAPGGTTCCQRESSTLPGVILGPSHLMELGPHQKAPALSLYYLPWDARTIEEACLTESIIWINCLHIGNPMEP